MIIDVHAHYFPAAYRPMLGKLAAKSGASAAATASSVLAERKTFEVMTDEPGMIEQRVAMMDEAGVERADPLRRRDRALRG